MNATDPVRIRGESLTALALAARLARHSHQVHLLADAAWGGRLAPRALRLDGTEIAVDDLAPITTLPAAWRDLMKKSGQPMAGFLNAAGLEMVEAPPARHLFPDGSQVELPADRGGQVKALSALMGRPAALAWAELLDRADEVWQELRFSGTERPFDPTLPLDRLRPKQTLADWAERLPDDRLRLLWWSEASRAGASDPQRAPVLLASRWSVQRTFGRWQLRAADGYPRPLSALVEPLLQRVRSAGVSLDPDQHPVAEATVQVDTTTPDPPPPRWPWQRAARPVAPPTISHALANPEVIAQHRGDQIVEEVEHTTSGHPIVRCHRLVDADHALISTHDHTQPGPPDRRWGWTIDTFAQWRSRPDLGGGGHWRGGAASHAGNEPWAELLTAALLSYQIHEALTGDDIRPTNKFAPRPPRR